MLNYSVAELRFYTKGKLSDVVEKSIPKNIDRDLKQKM